VRRLKIKERRIYMAKIRIRKITIKALVAIVLFFVVSAPVYTHAGQSADAFDKVLASNKKILALYPSNRESFTHLLEPTRKIESDHDAIMALAASITKNAETDYDKAYAIHQWVANNIEYDYQYAKNVQNPNYEKHNEYGHASHTLLNKTGVCEGISNLTVALLRAAGIPAKIAIGDIMYEDYDVYKRLDSFKWGHQWYEVYINGKWLIGDSQSASMFNISLNDASEILFYDLINLQILRVA
jgi:transglutaminase-like putative cysteine protease